jgi:hypothetical protein
MQLNSAVSSSWVFASQDAVRLTIGAQTCLHWDGRSFASMSPAAARDARRERERDRVG